MGNHTLSSHLQIDKVPTRPSFLNSPTTHQAALLDRRKEGEGGRQVCPDSLILPSQMTDNKTGEVLFSEKVVASIEPERNQEGDWKVRTYLAPRYPGTSIFL